MKQEENFSSLVTEILTLVGELVRLPSESSGSTLSDPVAPEQKVREHLVALFTARQIPWFTQEVCPGRANLVARFRNDAAPRVLIVGHMDTVSGAGMAAPFAGNLADGRIRGRGACDDKGPIAAVVLTILAAAAQQGALPFDLYFAATVDEECTLAGAAALAPLIGGWDLCIALEPTQLRLVNRHKGVYRFKVKTTGVAAHASTPEKGTNAVVLMAEVIRRLDRFAAFLDSMVDDENLSRPDGGCGAEATGSPTLCITRISGGTAVNVVPADCEIEVDMRILPGTDLDRIKKEIGAIVGNLGMVSDTFFAGPMATNSSQPLIGRFQDCLFQNGIDPAPLAVSFATDCSRLAATGPCVVWGPGDIAQAHSCDEYIEIDQLAKAAEIILRFLGR